MATTLPHFRDSFPEPAPHHYSYLAPLSASSLQAYNAIHSAKRNASHLDLDSNDTSSSIDHNKRILLDRPFARQRQVSGCSVSSASSWSSSASFSTVSSSPSSSPSSLAEPLSASRSPSPVESFSDNSSSSDEYNPLWHICDAIALAERQDVKKPAGAKTIRRDHQGAYGVKIVFLEPNWLAEHMAKSKKVAALKRRQQHQQQ
ncbi:hypothetical protein BGZ98_007604, partial [Dissophora globulifera]